MRCRSSGSTISATMSPNPLEIRSNRYSGEFTVFRELLQNADDANASSVEVHFKSQVASPDGHPPPPLKTTNLASIVVRNDGIVFRDEDWKRLRTIADGQPDETKIGAFGERNDA